MPVFKNFFPHGEIRQVSISPDKVIIYPYDKSAIVYKRDGDLSASFQTAEQRESGLTPVNA